MSWLNRIWQVARSVVENVVNIGRAAAAQSTVEYALVGALVVIAAAGALTLLGGQLTMVFTHISDTLKGAAH